MASSLLSLHIPNPKPTRIFCSTATTTTYTSPQSLDAQFGRKGIRFTTDPGGVPAVELSVRNGSSLRLRIPDGLVTSYRPKVYWRDDGFEELLHTVEAEGRPIKGGVGLVLNDLTNVKDGKDGSPLRASEWTVRDSDSDSIDAVQVELSSTNGDGSVDIIYIVSLYAESMTNAVVVKNKGRKPVTLSSAVLSHLKFKSRKGSGIQGLKGCSYSTFPPPPSEFGILSPADAMKREENSGWFGGGESEKKQGEWAVEDLMYTVLKGKLSRVYTAPPEERLKRIYNTPPSMYKTIDQGNGLGFRVIRMGYDDIYLCSPGSLSEKYGHDYFICTGPASIVVPVVVNPGEEWRGAQVIEHDNL